MSIDAEPTPLDRSSAPPLRVVAWELTAACPLQCRHCRVGDGGRAGADHAGRSDELSPAEARDALDQIAALAPKLLILTGGEPMLREDFYDLTARAVGHGLRVAAAPCGALVTPDTARRMLQAGIRRISLSLDGPDAATHDAFRGTTGAHATVLSAVAAARVAGLPFQINTTVHRGNVEALPAMREQVRQEGAAGWDLFFLVPTGRGRALAGQELAPD
ncbi:MAG: radical SAM protein, partial [Planctomycetota bacterium]